jgi:hypothetical protein
VAEIDPEFEQVRGQVFKPLIWALPPAALGTAVLIWQPVGLVAALMLAIGSASIWLIGRRLPRRLAPAWYAWAAAGAISIALVNWWLLIGFAAFAVAGGLAGRAFIAAVARRSLGTESPYRLVWGEPNGIVEAPRPSPALLEERIKALDGAASSAVSFFFGPDRLDICGQAPDRLLIYHTSGFDGGRVALHQAVTGPDRMPREAFTVGNPAQNLELPGNCFVPLDRALVVARIFHATGGRAPQIEWLADGTDGFAAFKPAPIQANNAMVTRPASAPPPPRWWRDLRWHATWLTALVATGAFAAADAAPDSALSGLSLVGAVFAGLMCGALSGALRFGAATLVILAGWSIWGWSAAVPPWAALAWSAAAMAGMALADWPIERWPALAPARFGQVRPARRNTDTAPVEGADLVR